MTNLLSVNQVAFILKVHPLTIRRYIRDGKLKAIRMGGNVRIEEKELENFQKDVIPPTSEEIVLKKAKKFPAKQFNSEDPFLRLQGRGASIN